MVCFSAGCPSSASSVIHNPPTPTRWRPVIPGASSDTVRAFDGSVIPFPVVVITCPQRTRSGQTCPRRSRERVILNALGGCDQRSAGTLPAPELFENRPERHWDCVQQ